MLKRVSALIVFLVGLSSSPAFAKHGHFAILQGATNETTTQFAIVVPKKGKYQYELSLLDHSQNFQPLDVRPKGYSHSKWRVDQVIFTNLIPGENYFLKVKSRRGSIIDQRRLHLLKINTPYHEQSIKIAWTSCSNDLFITPEKKMWIHVKDENPDAVFMIGDNVYAANFSPVNPLELWDRNIETRNKLKIFRQEKLFPTFATWDDHDYGVDNGDRTYPFRSSSKWVFRAFFPQNSLDEFINQGPGISESFDAFGMRFYFMDGRTFKSTKKDKVQSLWGTDQENWLKDQLLDGNNKISWLINGTQTFDGKHESYEGDFKESFQSFRKLISSLNYPMIFASGDIHYSEIMKVEREMLGYDTFEITSSSIHSTRVPFSKIPKNRRRIAGVYEDNFLVTTLSGTEKQLDINVSSIGKDRKVYFQKELTLSY